MVDIFLNISTPGNICVFLKKNKKKLSVLGRSWKIKISLNDNWKAFYLQKTFRRSWIYVRHVIHCWRLMMLIMRGNCSRNCCWSCSTYCHVCNLSAGYYLQSTDKIWRPNVAPFYIHFAALIINLFYVLGTWNKIYVVFSFWKSRLFWKLVSENIFFKFF